MMAELGLASYRFSVAWPRIQPDGTGPVNPRGLDFYDRLIDELLGQGHRPDRHALPLGPAAGPGGPRRLDRTGRPPSPSPSTRRSCTRASATGSRTWTTLNEPWCSAYLGYASGVHAPGRTDPAAAFAAVHHLLLGHGLAARRRCARPARRGRHHAEPGAGRAGRPGRARPTRRPSGCVDGLHNRHLPGPAAARALPGRRARAHGRFTDLAFIRDGDEAIINAADRPARASTTTTPTYVVGEARRARRRRRYPGTEGIAFRAPVGPVTDMGWPIEPAGLTALLERLARRLSGVPLLITENGAAFPTTAPSAGRRGARRRPGRLPRRAPARRARGDPRGRRPARILRLVVAGQLRVGRGLRASGSASCTSTTRPSGGSPRTARGGTAEVIRRNGL